VVIDLSQYRLETLRQDGEFILCRGLRQTKTEMSPPSILALSPVMERPAPATLKKMEHEFSLKDELDPAWAIRPIAFTQDQSRTMLLCEDADGEPLDRLLRGPLELKQFLSCGIGLAAALGQAHRHGLIHKDIKPSNVFVSAAMDHPWLMGFGIASRLPRERQPAEPPEFISGTLAYMAPEQTGRMNRSIDSRSDLYALGITLYELLTGSLPFTASDPMEWVHCHTARQPLAPAARLRDVPCPVSAIILKLLAKTPEERYQTAAGVQNDLRRCMERWDRERSIHDFPLRERDRPDRLLIPEKLYGREREIETLLASFDRVVKSGKPQLVLVSGYSGIGKSSLVNELYKVLVPSRGIFASGKFDQYKRDIPYSTLAQAFQSLIRRLLANSEGDLTLWRDAIREALGPNGRLMVDLVPELKLIIGEQSPVPELPPQDAQRRFQLVFRRFIGVFARPEHPLALFVDDLQWLDAATLEVLEDLLRQADVHHLLVIGAYRDNEVDAAHPLTATLEAIRAEGSNINEIKLAPLSQENVAQLVMDAFQCEPERVLPLVKLIYRKTQGNPFFFIQFISVLERERLVAFDHEHGRWSWDLARIHAKGYTDNVVDLMIGKLRRLPAETQNALQQLACLGNAAKVTTLSLVYGTEETQVHSDLFEAIRADMVGQQGNTYKFSHDRVQEAAYSLIPVRLRPEAHLRIGRLLLAHTVPREREEVIFEIVNQLNRGAALIASREEREELAGLDLIAGKRARAATAYAAALNYLVAGGELLADDRWQRCHALSFALELNRAECEFLTGDLSAAEKRLAEVSTFAGGAVDEALVACLRIDLYSALQRNDCAVEVSLDYLRRRGVDWSPHPTDAEARQEYERIWSLLGSRTIEQLIDLPSMTDPESIATLDVLYRVVPSALFTDKKLSALLSCKAITLNLEKGNSDGSCLAYVVFAMIAGREFGDYKVAFRFGQLGYELVEQRGLKRFQPATYFLLGGIVFPWTKHLRVCRNLVRRAFAVANEIGDLTFAVYSSAILIANLFAAGDPLPEVQRAAESGLAFAQRARFGSNVDMAAAHLGLIRTLRGLTRTFGRFDDGQFDERQFERHLSSTAGQEAVAEGWWWIRKLQARFFAGDYAAALDADAKAQKLLWAVSTISAISEHCFFAALSHAVFCDLANAGERGQHLEALAGCRRQLQIWAENCPENFAHRAALVGAEIARLEGRPLEAMDLYERALRSAKDNGFVHDEGLANELAARFYAARGFEKIARVYLRDARYCYLHWGADGKVAQLDKLYPYLRQDEQVPGPTSTIGAPVEHLDLATVTKVSQAVSGEMMLERLLDTLMRLAIEHAGAERSVLLLSRGDELRQEAEATTKGEAIIVRRRDGQTAGLPDSIVHYVMRTREIVILDDALTHPTFSTDLYVHERKAKSILCLPLVNEAKLIGVLYLENNLTSHVFAPTRIAILKLLALQAAISLENTRLYRDLADREEKIRRLVDANILGICVWNLEGAIVEANEAFLHMLRYGREDVVSGRLRWTDLTPTEWRERDECAVAELRSTGTFQPFEKEYFRKDGSRVPVLIGGALFEESGNEGVAFVLDLTERKRAEQEHERLRQLESDLAHVNRLSMMGELAASLAHEVLHPIATARNNARVGTRFLEMTPPRVGEAREALNCVVRDVDRAKDIVGRMRDHIRKAPPRREYFDLNEAVSEVIVMARSAIAKNGIAVSTELMDGLAPVQGDRVQLQQVVLNLVLNAIEAMGSVEVGGRELLVWTEQTEAQGVLVAVGDSGPGIDPGHLDRVFEAFYTTKISGVGMGLSICRSIIDAHGGQLWANANEPRGAVFRFTLPAAQGGS
jgi:PAS domain S-box-containing protein